MFRKYVLPIIITLVFGAIFFYLALPPINLKSGAFWFFIIFLVAIYFGSSAIIRLKPGSNYSYKIIKAFDKSALKRFKVIALTIAGIVILAIAAIIITSSKMFNAAEYQTMLKVTESDFNKDISEIPFSQIPIVDKDTAARLGARKLGEVVELVSQFNISGLYTQINYNQKPVRVSPLEYAGFLKWFVNRKEGIPYYLQIDMATQKTDLVKLENGMKYSPSEYFGRDLMRHIRFLYPTKMFNEVNFEIDENGRPYWTVSYYDYTIGLLGGRDITGIILVDAITGETTNYPISQVPAWIDRVYSADMVLKQAHYWGAFRNGYWNSIFAQKGVVTTTEGYNYLAVDDDIWLYTGITSVVADESNIGFLLVNMRTKEGRMYPINGAEEFSAMESAQGVIQEKGYIATFPILINVADHPTYFLSLKDNAGLVKAFAFVSVSDYQIVGVADTIEGAEREYMRLLGVDTNKPDIEDAHTATIAGMVKNIASVVTEGNTRYYIEMYDSDYVYIASLDASIKLPFIKTGDSISITYYTQPTNQNAYNVKSIDIIVE